MCYFITQMEITSLEILQRVYVQDYNYLVLGNANIQLFKEMSNCCLKSLQQFIILPAVYKFSYSSVSFSNSIQADFLTFVSLMDMKLHLIMPLTCIFSWLLKRLSAFFSLILHFVSCLFIPVVCFFYQVTFQCFLQFCKDF